MQRTALLAAGPPAVQIHGRCWYRTAPPAGGSAFGACTHAHQPGRPHLTLVDPPQVLDDSTCKATRALVDDKVLEWKERGVNVDCIRRTNRQGYKAGALKEVRLQRSGVPATPGGLRRACIYAALGCSLVRAAPCCCPLQWLGACTLQACACEKCSSSGCARLRPATAACGSIVKEELLPYWPAWWHSPGLPAMGRKRSPAEGTALSSETSKMQVGRSKDASLKQGCDRYCGPGQAEVCYVPAGIAVVGSYVHLPSHAGA